MATVAETALRSENARLRRQIGELEHQLQACRDCATAWTAAERRYRLRVGLSLTVGQAALLDVLYAAERPITPIALLQASALDHSRPRLLANVKVRVCQLRKLIGPDCIGRGPAGYQLTSEGRDEIRRACFTVAPEAPLFGKVGAS